VKGGRYLNSVALLFAVEYRKVVSRMMGSTQQTDIKVLRAWRGGEALETVST